MTRRLTRALETDLFKRDDRWMATRMSVVEEWVELGLLTRGAIFMDMEGFGWRDPYLAQDNEGVRGMVSEHKS